MKIVSKIRVQFTEEQIPLAAATLREANLACNWVSAQAWGTKSFEKFDLIYDYYFEMLAKFPKLGSQLIQNSIGKVANSYETDRTVQHQFRLEGAISYDKNVLSWDLEKQLLSIKTTSGRLQKIPFVGNQKDLDLLKSGKIGEAKLFARRGNKFYLHVVIETKEPEVKEPENGFLAVDLGVTNVAYLSSKDGNRFKELSNEIKRIRAKRRKERKTLQKCKSRSAKRKLKKLSGIEARFARDLNHQLSKFIVLLALALGKAIVLEDLTYINEQLALELRNGRYFSKDRMDWSFAQLRAFVEYKAKKCGVLTILVDPAFSSQECSCCGHVEEKNRKGIKFSCLSCGFTAHADKNGALVLEKRGTATYQLAYRSKKHLSKSNEIVPFDVLRKYQKETRSSLMISAVAS